MVTVTLDGAGCWWFEGDIPRVAACFFDMAIVGPDGSGFTADRVKACAAFDWLAEGGCELAGVVPA